MVSKFKADGNPRANLGRRTKRVLSACTLLV
jgi:hypothetical protein